MDFYGNVRELYASGGVFTAFDIETTGLDPQKDRIVEIGAVKFDNKGIIARFSTLIDPGIPMPPEAGRVNNITDSMLSGQPPLDEALPDFIRFTGGAVITAHNAPFDCGFVNAALKDRFVRAQKTGAAGFWVPPWPALPNTIADTLALAKETLSGLPSYKLQSLAAHFTIPLRDAHRAEDDARVCMEIFIQLLK
jgi:DNA polymerase-3 subunit epsilon